MLYSEQTVLNEIRWEYGLSAAQALNIIEQYKSQGQYKRLCHLIEKRKALSIKEVQHGIL